MSSLSPSPEWVLSDLAETLVQHFRNKPPWGYLRGKSLMRDVLVHAHHLSDLQAETAIDTMEMHGYLHFLGDPTQPSLAHSRWKVAVKPTLH